MNEFSLLLGLPLEEGLGQSKFGAWPNEVVRNEPDDPHFLGVTFSNDGFEVVCDENETIKALYFHVAKFGGFKGDLSPIQFTMSAEDLTKILGAPVREMAAQSIPGLGDYGAWQLFDRGAFVIHIEYSKLSPGVETITMMTREAASL